jgi:MtrB/PioB family decaheme-associated outer membrane protein
MRTLIAVIVTICALPLADPAHAQVDTSDWKCELCPFEAGYDADYEVGALYVSDDAYRFGNATGLGEEGVSAALDGEGRYASDGYQARWRIDDLGLDTREVLVEAGRQGSYGVYLGYDELPYRQFDTTATIFAADGNEYLRLPPGWITAGSTGGMTALPGSLRPVEIGTDRSTYSAGGHLLASGFRFFADYRRQEKDGVRIDSGSRYSQASLLPRFIDYQTDTIDVGVRYASGPLALSLSWYGSFFENNAASLTWENPFYDDPATAGFDPLRTAVEPDNDFQQLSLSGSYRFDTFDTLLAFMVATGRGDQDEPLLPYTVNPSLAPGSLPRATADGKVDTRNYSLTVATRPLPNARLNAWYRFDERDNGTPRDTWNRVITDSFTSNDPVMNTPYSFERTRLGVSGEFQVMDGLRLSAGAERTDLDRDFQEVAEQTADDGWGKLRLRFTEWLDFSLKAGAARREIDRYDETVAADYGQNPLMRKYNLAYRYRDYSELMFSIAPAGFPVSATLTAVVTDDSYSQSRLGLTESQSSNVSIDLGWSVTANTSVYFLVGNEEIDAEQFGSGSFAVADWSAAHEDSFLLVGGGLVMRNIGDNVDLTLDYARTDGETDIRVERTGFGASDFPGIDTRMESLRLNLTYRRSERLDIDLSLRYESFDSNDWALAGVEPDTVPTVLTLGADPYDYDVWVLGLGFRYLIGPREIAFPE